MIAQFFGYPLGAVPILGQDIFIRIDVHIHKADQPMQPPIEILLPAELAQHNHGQFTFWLTGFTQQIPPAILAWLRHHPHYSSLIQTLNAQVVPS